LFIICINDLVDNCNNGPDVFLNADDAISCADILHIIMEIYYKRIYLIFKYGWKLLLKLNIKIVRLSMMRVSRQPRGR